MIANGSQVFLDNHFCMKGGGSLPLASAPAGSSAHPLCGAQTPPRNARLSLQIMYISH